MSWIGAPSGGGLGCKSPGRPSDRKSSITRRSPAEMRRASLKAAEKWVPSFGRRPSRAASRAAATALPSPRGMRVKTVSTRSFHRMSEKLRSLPLPLACSCTNSPTQSKTARHRVILCSSSLRTSFSRMLPLWSMAKMTCVSSGCCSGFTSCLTSGLTRLATGGGGWASRCTSSASRLMRGGGGGGGMAAAVAMVFGVGARASGSDERRVGTMSTKLAKQVA